MFSQDIPDLTAFLEQAAQNPDVIPAVWDLVRRRVDKWEPLWHAFVYLAPDAFTGLPPKGSLLEGAPFGIKDLFHVAGMPTRLGSRAYYFTPKEDAAVVSRLRYLGAKVVGKTNTHEIALGTFTPGTKNPWNPSRIPGGSSGGSAAALAGGMVLAALGTDTAGSVRIPAALSGVVGYKPAWGTLPLDGVYPLSPTLDHVGLLTHSVRDADRLIRWMQGSPLAAESPKANVPESWVVPWEYCTLCQPDILRSFQDLLEGLGVTGIPVAFEPWQTWNDAIFLPIRRRESYLVHEAVLRDATRRPLMDGAILGELDAGAKVSDHEYQAALDTRRQLQTVWRERLHHKVLVMPSVAVTAPPLDPGPFMLGSATLSPKEALTRFSLPWAVLGFPAIAVPMGLGDDGLPMSCQVVSAPGEEPLLFAAALRIEAACAWNRLPQPWQTIDL